MSDVGPSAIAVPFNSDEKAKLANYSATEKGRIVKARQDAAVAQVAERAARAQAEAKAGRRRDLLDVVEDILDDLVAALEGDPTRIAAARAKIEAARVKHPDPAGGGP